MSRFNMRVMSWVAPLLTLMLASCAELPTDLETEAPPVTAPPVYSGPFDGELRLGVVPSATEVIAGGTESFSIVDRVTGATLLEGNAESASITYSSQTVPGKTSWRLLVLCGTEAERDAKVAAAEALEYVTYTVHNGTCWEVYLGDLSLSTASATRRQFQNVAVQNGLATTTDLWVRVTTVASVAGFRIVMGDRNAQTPNFIEIRPTSGQIVVGEQTYDGSLVVFRNSAGSLTAVNEIPVETYLKGVLPLVLPPETYGQGEAQKAQAVAERTRALYNVGRHAAEGFDFYPGEFQPYGGSAVQHEISNAAIEATAGVVATFEGELMDTPYHPASGGWTANSEDVFEPTVPYLRGVIDSDRGHLLEVLTLVAFKLADKFQLKASSPLERGVWSKFDRWSVEWTEAELAEVLSAAFGTTITDITSIKVLDRGTYGRVRCVEFVTDAGTFVANKHDIRNKLRWKTEAGEWELLPSTLFFVTTLQDDGEGVSGWRVYGAGLGHGVGMSQIGAVNMAGNGKTFQEILSKYYTGVVLEQRY